VLDRFYEKSANDEKEKWIQKGVRRTFPSADVEKR
jgi:hypothetical protein